MTTHVRELSPSGDYIADYKTKTEPGSEWKSYGSPEDASRCQWMKMTQTSSGYQFLNHPDEDVYSMEDGEEI